MKIRDRYFVVNRYPGKNGLRQRVFEYRNHDDANTAAAYAALTVLDLCGDFNDEEWYVFVGSKGAMERAYPDPRIERFSAFSIVTLA